MNAFQNGRAKAEAAIQQRLGNAQRTPEYAASLGQREGEQAKMFLSIDLKDAIASRDRFKPPPQLRDVVAEKAVKTTIQLGLTGAKEKKAFVDAFVKVCNANYSGRVPHHSFFDANSPKVRSFFERATNLQEFERVAQEAKSMVGRDPEFTEGAVAYFTKELRKRIKGNESSSTSMSGAREDRLLRTRDSTGKAKARR